jgi:hypothetical protein
MRSVWMEFFRASVYCKQCPGTNLRAMKLTCSPGRLVSDKNGQSKKQTKEPFGRSDCHLPADRQVHSRVSVESARCA